MHLRGESASFTLSRKAIVPPNCTTQQILPAIIAARCRVGNLADNQNVLGVPDTRFCGGANFSRCLRMWLVRPMLNGKEPLWESTSIQNLLRYRRSGTYFARFQVGGRRIRQSLETTVFSVAKQRLPEKIRDYRSRYKSSQAFAVGKMTVGDAVEVYVQKARADVSLKPRSRITARRRLTSFAAPGRHYLKRMFVKLVSAIARIGLCDFSSVTLQPWSTTASAHCERFSNKRLAQGRDLIIQPAAFHKFGCGRSNWNFHRANSS